MNIFETVDLKINGATLIGFESATADQALDQMFKTASRGFICQSTSDYRDNLDLLKRVAAHPEKLVRREMSIVAPHGDSEKIIEMNGNSIDELQNVQATLMTLFERSSETARYKSSLETVLTEYSMNLKEHVFAIDPSARFSIACYSEPRGPWLVCNSEVGKISLNLMAKSYLQNRATTRGNGGFGLPVILSMADILLIIGATNGGSIFAAQLASLSLSKDYSRGKALFISASAGEADGDS